MEEYKPPFTITNEILSYVSSISEKIGRISVTSTSNALMEKLGLKSKEGFRRNYLRPAVDMNLIRMTIPDKPNSRNQRYVKIFYILNCL